MALKEMIFGKDIQELCFTALGPRGAGKTTLLSCIHREFEAKWPGTFSPSLDVKVNGRNTFAILKGAYDKLIEKATAPSDRISEYEIEATSELREYVFNFLNQKKVPIRVFDFPGDWLKSDNMNYSRVVEIMKRSMVILVAVNTPYIMEDNGRFIEKAGIEDIERCLLDSLNTKDDKLIIMVPIKCEKYTRTPENCRAMRKRIKEVFSTFFTKLLSLDSERHAKLAVAMLPVHTVGNLEFDKFVLNGGRLSGVDFRKTGERFCPHDVDQPMRFVMSFLLNEFESSKSGYWQKLLGLVFTGDKRRREELTDAIREDMHPDDDNFEIYCGRQLIV